MKKWMKFLLYILINILVSGLTVVGVLWLWDNTHSVPCPVIPAAELSTPLAPISQGQDLSITPTFDYSDIELSIDNVFGVGQYDFERIFIKNTGKNSANLLDWKIQNEKAGDYTFPSMILNEGGAVNLLSQTGNNTVIELFWGRTESIWQSGDVVNLVAPDGEIHASYQIP